MIAGLQRKIGIALALLAAMCLTSRYAMACSMCAFGDNLFSMAEQNTTLPFQYQQHSLRLNLQGVYSSKSNALDQIEGPGTERERELRPSLKATYGVSRRLSAAIQLPLPFKRIQTSAPMGGDLQTSAGFGDAELSAIWNPLSSSESRPVQIGLAGGLKLPTGRNNQQREGERLDEHLQSGTGSYDWQTGIAIGHSGSAFAVFGSFYYKHNGTNSHTYHYGNILLYNAGIQRRLSTRFTANLQVNGRTAKRDIESSTPVDNTGGTAVYIAPGLNIDLGRTVSFVTNLQLPVYQHLYGTQNEKAVLSAGFNFDVL